MPFGLLKFGLAKVYPARGILPGARELKGQYDVVIIGGGGHGLAAAYYLAKDWGITNVAVLEKSYVGGGNTGRNTAIIRANYISPEGERLYLESLRLWQGLTDEFSLNIQYSRRGNVTLTHTDSGLRTLRWRNEVSHQFGVDSDLIYPDEIGRLIPGIDFSKSARYPILGALYHSPGATARHDAVAWGYAEQASRRGVEIHMKTEVTGILQDAGRVIGVETNRGNIHCERVLQAVAGSSSLVARMAGFGLPVQTLPLQACVTEPLKAFLNPVVSSDLLHVYMWQTARGELVIGGVVDGYTLYSNRSTLNFLEDLAAHTLELFPFLGDVSVMRQWCGVCDVSPDASPVLGTTPLENYFIDSGTGTWGFKATPICGKMMAETVATGRPPEMIQPFRLQRFADMQQIGEGGASAVGH